MEQKLDHRAFASEFSLLSPVFFLILKCLFKKSGNPKWLVFSFCSWISQVSKITCLFESACFPDSVLYLPLLLMYRFVLLIWFLDIFLPKKYFFGKCFECRLYRVSVTEKWEPIDLKVQLSFRLIQNLFLYVTPQTQNPLLVYENEKPISYNLSDDFSTVWKCWGSCCE